MCHNAPWLSVLDKQMQLQFAPKEFKADVVSRVLEVEHSILWVQQQRSCTQSSQVTSVFAICCT